MVSTTNCTWDTGGTTYILQQVHDIEIIKHVELINRRMVPLDKPAVGHLIFQTPVSPLNMFQQTHTYYQVTDVLDCSKDSLCYGLLVVNTSGQLHGL